MKYLAAVLALFVFVHYVVAVPSWMYPWANPCKREYEQCLYECVTCYFTCEKRMMLCYKENVDLPVDDFNPWLRFGSSETEKEKP
ncbi:hypothetical protein ScPMuIL_006253 [Solemya velum]